MKKYLHLSFDYDSDTQELMYTVIEQHARIQPVAGVTVIRDAKTGFFIAMDKRPEFTCECLWLKGGYPSFTFYKGRVAGSDIPRRLTSIHEVLRRSLPKLKAMLGVKGLRYGRTIEGSTTYFTFYTDDTYVVEYVDEGEEI